MSNKANMNETVSSIGKALKRVMSVFVILVLVLLVLTTGIKTVKTGEIGIVSTFGKVSGTKEAGINFIIPFVQKMTMIKVTQDKFEKGYEVSTRDMQTIQVDIALQYSVDPSMATELFTKFGSLYVEGILAPTLADSVNSAIADYTIEEFVGKRTEIADTVQENTKSQLMSYGIRVIDVAITNHDFSDAYEAAVERKKIAEQETAAKAEEVKQAELAAERNRIMADSYTKENYLREFLDKWDGKLPVVVGNEQVIIDMLNGTTAQDIYGNE